MRDGNLILRIQYRPDPIRSGAKACYYALARIIGHL
jgi:hypothetical protein